MAIKAFLCITVVWLRWTHMLGISLLSSDKRLFTFAPCWSNIRVKHKIPHLDWPYLKFPLSHAYSRVYHLLGYA